MDDVYVMNIDSVIILLVIFTVLAAIAGTIAWITHARGWWG